jgi:hypothetical protein
VSYIADSVHVDNDQEAAVLRLGYVSSAIIYRLFFLSNGQSNCQSALDVCNFDILRILFLLMFLQPFLCGEMPAHPTLPGFITLVYIHWTSSMNYTFAQKYQLSCTHILEGEIQGEGDRWV